MMIKIIAVALVARAHEFGRDFFSSNCKGSAGPVGRPAGPVYLSYGGKTVSFFS
jgi:hypothetical protein